MKLLILSKEEVKVFLWILGLSIFGLISLFQANTLYLDDYWRLVDGNMGWNFNARPLATFIITFLQLGKPFTDISPFFQIIGIAFFALGIIYLKRIFALKNNVLLVLIGVITILNPYNLSMYAFVLDSLSMNLAILCMILSLYLTIYTKDNIQNFTLLIILTNYIVVILLLIGGLCLYQTSIAFYFIGNIFYLLSQLCKNKKNLQSFYAFIINNIILLLGMILYIPIKNLYELDEYTLKGSQLPEFNQLIPTVTYNILKAWNLIKYHLGINIIILSLYLLGILALFIITFKCLFENKRKKFFKNNLISFGLAIIYYLIILTSFIFPSYILLNPPWHTRIFLGFVVFVSCSCFFIAKFFSDFKYKYLEFILIFYYSFLALSFINISLTFGNVLHQQNLYEERVGLSIIRDVEDLSNQYSLSLDKIKISFANQQKTFTLKTNNIVQKSLEKYPIVNSLAYQYLSPDNFGITKLKTFGYNLETLPKEDFFRDNQEYYQPIQPPILKRQLYNIYLENNDIFIITFNE